MFDDNDLCEFCGEPIDKHDPDLNFQLNLQFELYQEMLINTTYNQNSTLI